MNKRICLPVVMAAAFNHAATACTGITFKATDTSTVVARTIEWGGSYLASRYVVVPRGHSQQSYAPDGKGGMEFTADYGYVGIAVQSEEFVAEGINEAGLSAGLFYFPGSGEYEPFDPQMRERTAADLQLVSIVLGRCASVEEVIKFVRRIRIVGILPGASTIHWRFADKTGRQVVLEIIARQTIFHENRLGVLTNSPRFDWHLTNLDNYINLYPGSAPTHYMGGIELSPLSSASGSLGLPGDFTSPSRFVRAAFFQTTAPQPATGIDAVRLCFQILNNFDIPIGVEFAVGDTPPAMPSATQWTSATDLNACRFYFRTMYDSRIRCIDLRGIDFSLTEYLSRPIDPVQQTEIVDITSAITQK